MWHFIHITQHYEIVCLSLRIYEGLIEIVSLVFFAQEGVLLCTIAGTLACNDLILKSFKARTMTFKHRWLGLPVNVMFDSAITKMPLRCAAHTIAFQANQSHHATASYQTPGGVVCERLPAVANAKIRVDGGGGGGDRSRAGHAAEDKPDMRMRLRSKPRPCRADTLAWQ